MALSSFQLCHPRRQAFLPETSASTHKMATTAPSITPFRGHGQGKESTGGLSSMGYAFYQRQKSFLKPIDFPLLSTVQIQIACPPQLPPLGSGVTRTHFISKKSCLVWCRVCPSRAHGHALLLGILTREQEGVRKRSEFEVGNHWCRLLYWVVIFFKVCKMEKGQ